MRALDKTDPWSLVSALRESLARRTPKAEAADGALPAGVLVPLQHHDGDWHVILNMRSEHVSQHRGEVAFPGGRLEPDDDDMTACALRETWEEMGIEPGDIDVLGTLDATLTRTNYLVWPTVGVVPHPYEFRPDPREVAEVIEVPLTDLLDESSALHEARIMPDGRIRRRKAYGHGDYLVFGATAWILSDLLTLVNEVGWNNEGRPLAGSDSEEFVK